MTKLKEYRKGIKNATNKIREIKNPQIEDFEIGPILGVGTFGKVNMVHYKKN